MMQDLLHIPKNAAMMNIYRVPYYIYYSNKSCNHVIIYMFATSFCFFIINTLIPLDQEVTNYLQHFTQLISIIFMHIVKDIYMYIYTSISIMHISYNIIHDIFLGEDVTENRLSESAMIDML